MNNLSSFGKHFYLKVRRLWRTVTTFTYASEIVKLTYCLLFEILRSRK